MNSAGILFREEYIPPRPLTWPLILIGSATVVSTMVRDLPRTHPGIFVLLILGAALAVALLMEFVALVIEVRGAEVTFSITPFYRRRIAVADIRHKAAKTYPSPATSTARFSWRPPRHGVELTMKDGSTFTLMSAHAEKLSAAIEAASEIGGGR